MDREFYGETDFDVAAHRPDYNEAMRRKGYAGPLPPASSDDQAPKKIDAPAPRPSNKPIWKGTSRT